MSRLPCLPPGPLRAAVTAGFGAIGLSACTPDSSLTITNAVPSAEILSHADGDAVLEGYEVSFRGTGYDPDDGPADLKSTWWLGCEEICPATALEDSGFT